MIYLSLFLNFIFVGMMSFGGGYAALPIIAETVTQRNTWLTTAEFTDVITISQMTPGPIGINAATFVGVKLGSASYGIAGGILGGICATLGFVFPACILVTILAIIYKKYSKSNVMEGILVGLRPASVGLIASAAVSIIAEAFFGEKLLNITFKNIDFIAIVLAVLCFALMKKVKVLSSPIAIILFSGVVGGAAYLIQGMI